MSLQPRLIWIAAVAVIAWPSAPAFAARHSSGRGAKPAAHHAKRVPHHTSHTKTNRYRRPAVHRRPAPRHVTRTVRRPVNRTVVRTVRRYPVRRVTYRYVRRPYSFGGIRRYTYSYYPGRYRWRSSYYNRSYGLGRRQSMRGVRGIVEGVQGNGSNGTILLKTFRARSSRFRYGMNVSSPRTVAGTNPLHRYHVNNGTVYEILSSPRRMGTFASLYKGEQVLILTRPNQANTAQKVELFPGRRR